MVRRMGAIAFIFCCASVAWMILASTLVARTDESGSSQRDKLAAQWGGPQTQYALDVRAKTARGRTIAVALRSSRVDVHLNLEQRRVGLLWYNLYDVQFVAHYLVRNDTKSSNLLVRFAFPSANATYANFVFRIDGHELSPTALGEGSVPFELAPERETSIDVAYQSRGTDTWAYCFGSGIDATNDFALTMTTNFDAIDFPARTLLPTREDHLRRGWRLEWRYGTLVTSDGIGMAFPYPLQPGPLAQRITFWAPVALFFYFFVLLVITTLRGIDLHPINYFFLAAAFFAFHLLFAYLVDRIPIEAAFTICSIVTLFLTISYLRLVVGLRFAAFESGLAQLVYLILFSYALFNEGWSGLTITVGAIATLFVTMQATGRIRWSVRLASNGTQA
jgi:hypothetical protein